MFQKNVASTERNPRHRERELVSGAETTIAPGVRVEGRLKSPSSVVLHGIVEGDVELDGLLFVGESGRILGDITARDVMVRGTVEGRIVATERIELGSAARVRGDLKAKAVAIAAGAHLQGRVEMTAPSDSASPRQENALVGAEAAV